MKTTITYSHGSSDEPPSDLSSFYSARRKLREKLSKDQAEAIENFVLSAIDNAEHKRGKKP
ncbi:MAG TPA: hypothetical protein VGM86_00595 [Thermoanaerobaculia bacterium]|jgi:hypothetical protein